MLLGFYSLTNMPRAQENLPAVFTMVLNHLTRYTGFSFLVLMGGPDPSNNSSIAVSS
jgi:hypothetical protein